MKKSQNLVIEKTQKLELSQALYGLSRTLVANMVTGVSDGFEKDYKLQVLVIELNLMVKILF